MMRATLPLIILGWQRADAARRRAEAMAIRRWRGASHNAIFARASPCFCSPHIIYAPLRHGWVVMILKYIYQ